MGTKDRPPTIIPGLYLKETGVVVIDGKRYKTVSLERDTKWEHLKKPSYRIYNGSK